MAKTNWDDRPFILVKDNEEWISFRNSVGLTPTQCLMRIKVRNNPYPIELVWDDTSKWRSFTGFCLEAVRIFMEFNEPYLSERLEDDGWHR